MSEPMVVSIITPAFNSAELLEKCIDSVLNQTYPHVEHIIHDGGSTDETLEILKKYGDRIQWVSEPDRGQSDGLDKALARCTGDIIGVLNADDEYTLEACEWAVRQFEEHPEMGAIYGDQHDVDLNSDIIQTTIGPDYSFVDILTCDKVIPAQAAFIHRKAYEKVGFYADVTRKTCPDYEYWVRLGLEFPMLHVPGIVALYRWHPGSEGRQGKIIHDMIESKVEVMKRIMDDPNTSEEIRARRKEAHSGIYHWGAWSFRSNALLWEGVKTMFKSVLLDPAPRQFTLLTNYVYDIHEHVNPDLDEKSREKLSKRWKLFRDGVLYVVRRGKRLKLLMERAESGPLKWLHSLFTRSDKKPSS
jgi:glycosyltransferase involved in cell wall biosynthesis